MTTLPATKTAATTDLYSLDRLNDIVEPPPIDAWPPAAGFWFLATLLLLWLAALAWGGWSRYRRDRYRRQALAQLQQLSGRPDSNPLPELAELLKRTALAGYPRQQVAALSGDDWLRFLDCSAATDAFANGPAKRLASISYYSARSADIEQTKAIFAAAEHWIRHHQTERPC